jgi:hypothetical protein
MRIASATSVTTCLDVIMARGVQCGYGIILCFRADNLGGAIIALQ